MSVVGAANATAAAAATYCDLGDFAKAYQEVHGTLSFLVCVFGSVANVLNICVLTTKEMRWPTNLILTALAVSDLLVMLEYIPFAFHRYGGGRRFARSYTYPWAAFMLFHALYSQVFHFVSCCLTVLLAVWRYVTIRNSSASRTWCTMRRTLAVVVGTFVVCPVICAPLFLSLEIGSHNQTCAAADGRLLSKAELANYTGPTTARTIYYTTYITTDHYKCISFWVYGVVIKLFPCVLLTYLSWRLISVLLETKRRRRALLKRDIGLRDGGAALRPAAAARKADRDRQADRTSGMLVAVLLLFLITEFPQAILGLLSAIIGELFEKQCYIPLGDVMDILALTNSAINFILYCSMSRQFRTTFREFFRPKFFRSWRPLESHAEKTYERTQLTQVCSDGCVTSSGAVAGPSACRHHEGGAICEISYSPQLSMPEIIKVIFRR